MHGALLDPRVPALKVEEKWGQFIRTKDPVKRRWIAHNMDAQYRYMNESANAGLFHSRFRGSKGILGGPQRLDEGQPIVAGDIATFTQQSLAMVEMVFERIVIDELVTVGSMSGPTAFVHNVAFKQADAGNFYDAGADFNSGLDPDYSDCPANTSQACGEANGVDFALTSTLITADCKRLQANFCVPAEQDLQSQYGMSLGDRLRSFMALQMQREIQGEVLAQLIAGAGSTVTWTADAPAGSIYLQLDPKIWQATLYDAIAQADNEIFKSTDGYRRANWIAGDPDGLLYLQQLKQFAIESRDNVPRAQAGEGGVDEYANFQGVANGLYKLYKFPFMPANTLILGVKSDAPQEQAFMHAVYVPITDLGTFRDPGTAQVTVGAQTRYANAMLRPGLFATVSITPPAP